MTGYVTDQIGGTGSYIEMYWNSDVASGDFQAEWQQVLDLV